MASLWRSIVESIRPEQSESTDQVDREAPEANEQNDNQEEQADDSSEEVDIIADDQTPPPFPALNSAQRASAVGEARVVDSPRDQGQSPARAMGPPSLTPAPQRNPQASARTARQGPPGRLAPATSSTSGLGSQPSNGSRPLPVFNFSNVTPSARSRPTPQSSSSLPAPTTAPSSLAQARRKREKVALEPGYSQLDWANLKNSGKDLSGRPPGVPPVRITLEELKKHSKPEDAWTALGGKVYNLTPYLRFHPGGVKETMRCAGKDGTHLFNITHMWVNYDRMLANCFIGYLVPPGVN
ncbi:hypothetical protein BZA70DRAFT_147287 [Myxozyma melibiosi]|uniref:Cytochrome b5 heme-binding domain-containing protein n=1 Tax=Myxozyma melibiosi TaxID=54550 RepID=A0ABR1F7U7_9ASCO